MRKIVLMLAVAGVACISQAANWKWNCSNLYDGTGGTATENKYSGTTYLFDAGLTSQKAIFDAVLADKKVDFKTLSGYVTTSPVAAGVVNANLTTSQFAYGTGGKTYAYFFCVFDGSKIYFSANSADLVANTTDTAKSIPIGNQNNGSTTFSTVKPTGSTFAGAGYWSTVSVPEPTSGLLVMLGVGLMALRRRRA